MTTKKLHKLSNMANGLICVCIFHFTVFFVYMILKWLSNIVLSAMRCFAALASSFLLNTLYFFATTRNLSDNAVIYL